MANYLSRNLAKIGSRLALRESFQAHNSMEDDGIDHAILHGGGIHKEVTITCNPGDGNAHFVSLFTIQGAIHVSKLYARCYAERETPNVKFNTVYFDVLDSNTGHANITLNTGVNCDTIQKRAQIAKVNAATVAAEFTNSDQVNIVDAGLADIFSAFKIIPYSVDGTTTLRFSYIGDANTDLDLTIHIYYLPLSGATVTAI